MPEYKVINPDFHYEKGRQIGRGAFGVVYSCKFRKAERGAKEIDAVVKEIRAKPGETAKDIRKEGDILKKLKPGDHNHVLQLLDMQETSRTEVQLFFPRMDGDTVTFAEQHPTWFDNLSNFKDFATQTLKGLEFIHSRGYVHQDIKPDNIFYRRSSSGYVFKLADFGLAFHKSESDPDQGGTIVFLAPEYGDGGRITSKADVYSLFVTFACMLDIDNFDSRLTGKKPPRTWEQVDQARSWPELTAYAPMGRRNPRERYSASEALDNKKVELTPKQVTVIRTRKVTHKVVRERRRPEKRKGFRERHPSLKNHQCTVM